MTLAEYMNPAQLRTLIVVFMPKEQIKAAIETIDEAIRANWQNYEPNSRTMMEHRAELTRELERRKN